MCTNMFAWLLKILCQTFIAFDQNKIIYDKKKYMKTITRLSNANSIDDTMNTCICHYIKDCMSIR
jgi:hypothetical protein